MKDLRLVLAVFSAGMIFAGVPVALYQAHVCRLASEELVMGAQRHDILANVDLLTVLRRDKTDEIIQTKEKELSEQILDLSEAFPEFLLGDQLTAKILKDVANYRAHYPFKTGNPQTDQTVEALLSKCLTNRSGERVLKGRE